MDRVLRQLADLGQSIWYDNIRRGMLDSGELKALIDAGVQGVTSNPTIFMKAITQSDDYDEQMRSLCAAGKSALEIYETLAIQDIGRAADLFRPVYDRTDGVDGYVSIEVNPHLAFDTQRTIDEARRLFRALDRPNVMIKIPGTREGLPAIESAVAEGINVNVTLIFSVDVYADIMRAYLDGLRRFADSGKDPARVASVASFFVSRVDTLVDGRLQENAKQNADLLGKAAVANSKLAYRQFREVFDGNAFRSLRSKGARVQRPLWASTSTKNPNYSPTLYVETLIGPDTVNTVPPATLEAIRAGMNAGTTINAGIEDALSVTGALEAKGISLGEVTEELRRAGVEAFADSFDELLAGIESKRSALANA